MEDRSFRLYECPELGECYYEMRHASGMRVLICPKDMSSVYVALGVPTGSFDRARGEPAGVAHFLEHKMFETARGRDVETLFGTLGAEVNAYTTYDRTVYLFSGTVSKQGSFEKALAALLRMVSSLHIMPASVRRERSIIREEIRMGADDPWEVCATLLLRSLYRFHPVREDICGTEASVGRITESVLRQAFASRYDRGVMTLAVCGRVTPEQVLSVVEQCVGAKQVRAGKLEQAESGRRANMRPLLGRIREPATVFRKRAVKDMRIDAGGKTSGGRLSATKPVFSLGIKDPDVPTEPQALLRRDLCMCILSEMLFSCSEDFYNDLYELGLVTPGVSYGSTVGRGFGFYDFTGESDDPEAVYGAFLAYVDKLTRDGLPRTAFERSRRILYADYVTGFDSTEGIGGALLSYAMDGLSLYDFLPTVASITPEEVDSLFRRTFCPGQYALAVVYPPEA